MPVNKLITRDATNYDIETLAGLMTELGYPTTVEEMSTRFFSISRQPGYKIFIADLDGEAIGMAGTCTGYYFEKNGCYVRMTALVIKEAYRNKGIGKMLVEAAGA